ncbi:YheC/YheD family endospore coat-associated protein [Desmospora profundinema]|uniref:Glutathione synthase/RimK-type ligase-like ATP-grasp enzyme n=1 Tax=Desmospora profundinema TaxID=1571184 RepID=A0ABU1IPD9_9BACL|nr:YheC/YheD family protein [Desmospora profundinema]MDR6226654.1 glutathione synthase/RimK-type ligase-like ATP-grasp enzyme [Desmospora profundinema]
MKFPERTLLGIITCKSKRTPPFQEITFFKHLTQEGARLGLALIVFSPMDINWDHRKVSAWRWHPKNDNWLREIHPLPSLIYDRCYYTDSRQYMLYKPYVERLIKDSNVHLLGRPLSGKWSTYQLLKPHSSIRPHLPPTSTLLSAEDLELALNRHGSILIKPNGGSHGRGVIAVIPQGGRYHARGRTLRNHPVDVTLQTKKSAIGWIQRITANTRYIIQPYLSLVTADGYPFDIRILVQKNGSGTWETTGSAVRTGKVHSLTSNLHGGGKAERTFPFLQRQFSDDTTAQIMKTIEKLAADVPTQIENEHGRLVELGLDLGVDRTGRVWLLEVNSKPGRTVFLLTGEREQYRRSVLLPVEYARSFLLGPTGGSV